MSRPLVLDLDFTLLHLEQLPDSIEVPGRTRSAWIAPQTVELLHELQGAFDIVLATARSWDGTRWVWEGLAARGVVMGAVVIEDGALLGRPGDLQCLDATFDPQQWRAGIDARKTADWPAFEWQNDFQGCLVARCADKEAAAVLQQLFEQQFLPHAPQVRCFRDGRKVYLISRRADKWSALQQLLGENALLAIGVGDGENDVAWLTHVHLACTLTGAVPSITSLVQQKNGYLSTHSGHNGICDVLRYIGTSATGR